MNRSRLMASALLPALILGLTLLSAPGTAQAAKRITLQNATGYVINSALVVQMYQGWRVVGWFNIAPYSTRTLTFNEAGGNTFGYYAKFAAGAPKVVWAGKGNAPSIAVVNARMNHDARQQPYGNGLRNVKVRMKQGNSVKFTYNGPPQQSRNNWW